MSVVARSSRTRRAGVELTSDPAFTRRIRRLGWVSVFALGLLTLLAIGDHAATWAVVLMVVGWALMPSLLFLSIGNPVLRYALLLPGTSFPLGVLGMALGTVGTASAGWWLVAAGLTLGGAQGMWFWFRWIPVPRLFDDPFGRPRLAVIGAHVVLLVIGIAVVLVG